VNWLTKRIDIRPALLLGVLLTVLLASAGIAYAVTVNTMTTTELWPGEASIVNAPDLSVTDYELNYSTDLTGVVSVDVTLTNSDATNPHTADVDIAVGTTGTIESGSETSWTVTAGSSDTKTITLSNPVDLDDLDWVHIIVDETS
jgi:hypothetical protein